VRQLNLEILISTKMAKKEKWSFIVNPTAGGGAGKLVLPQLEKQLSDRSLDANILLTERHNHAIELSSLSLENECTHIIAVGGDGTMNEVARPLIGQKQITTGLIPAGTGNDFIQILGFPDRFSEPDWDVFFRQNSIHMDVGQVNELFFLNGMGLGFDAQVAAENYVEPGEVAKGHGKGKYIWHIVKTLLFYKEGKVSVVSRNQKLESDCFINTISIGRRFAGSFFLTPEAIANDGLLDVCMIKKLNLFQRFKILSMVPKGTHIKDDKVDYYQTKEINVDFREKVPFHVDGELYFDSKFEVSLLPSALHIIYKPGGKHFFNE
jgi:diacylglycerol kinase (ATP)